MSPAAPSGSAAVLDVRPMRKQDKHPAIFAAYDALPVGGSLVLINDHDPQHLRAEFEVEHPASHAWEYLRQEPGDWQIKITKLTAAPLPRVLVDTTALADIDTSSDTGSNASGVGAEPSAGAVWRLPIRRRDLDSNVIALPPGGAIEAHTGPDLDVLVHVLAGSGRVGTEVGEIEITPGALLWLPRRSRRSFTAGPDGLRYLTVHQRRRSLVIQTRPTDAS